MVARVPRAPKKQATAADVRAALAQYYKPPSHRLFFEVSNDTGARARRWIDALALGIWPSTGYEIVGIEVKVSRSDWKAELAQPRKAQELMRFCTRWFLACPAGMVQPDELPRTWGMLEVREDAVRQAVPAPLLDPEPLTPGFMMAVLRQANGVDAEVVEKLVAARVAELQKGVDKQIEYGIQRRASEVSLKNQRALEVAERLRALTGVDVGHWEMDTDALAAAYLFFKSTGLHRSVRWGFSELAGAADNLRKVADLLATVCEDEKFASVRAQIEREGSKRPPGR